MLSQAMLLAEGISPSTEEKLQPVPSLTSRSPEEEVGSLSDPLEAFPEYRRKSVQEPLAQRGELSKNDREPSSEKNWSLWPRSMALGLTMESYVQSYLEAYQKLKEEGPSRIEEGPKKGQFRALDRQPDRSEGSHEVGQEARSLNQPEAEAHDRHPSQARRSADQAHRAATRSRPARTAVRG